MAGTWIRLCVRAVTVVFFVLSLCGSTLLAQAAETYLAAGQWRQWGGPDRNFIVDGAQLADSWPSKGPP